MQFWIKLSVLFTYLLIFVSFWGTKSYGLCALLCVRQAWRLHLGVPSQAANPVVLVVDGDEQDVRSLGGGQSRQQ